MDRINQMSGRELKVVPGRKEGRGRRGEDVHVVRLLEEGRRKHISGKHTEIW